MLAKAENTSATENQRQNKLFDIRNHNIHSLDISGLRYLIANFTALWDACESETYTHAHEV